MDSNELYKFILESDEQSYKNENALKKAKEEADGSTTMEYVAGDWKFQDNFFGGEPYGGRAIVSYKNKPVWIFVYYGTIKSFVPNSQTDALYTFLRKALQKGKAPFRGPKLFEAEGLKYKNMYAGNIQHFFGKEYIYQKGKCVYQATYMGGLVDTRAGV